MGALLTIDPGIGSTGWALWLDEERLKPDLVGLCTQKGPALDFPWHIRAHKQAEDLVNATACHSYGRRDFKIYCEMPIFFAGTSGGIAAAETNSLQKLCYQVGAIGQAIYRSCPGATFTPIAVCDWKGQLPKAVVIKRIEKILGIGNCKNFKNDIWDSVGIGLSVKGVFK